MEKGLSHTHVGQLRIRRDNSAVEVSPEKPGVPVPHQAP